MTEDYLRRKLPQDFPVVYHKVTGESYLNMSDNCNNICINDFSSNNLSSNETLCLEKCYKKSVEFNFYLSKESNRIFVEEEKKMNRLDGV